MKKSISAIAKIDFFVDKYPAWVYNIHDIIPIWGIKRRFAMSDKKQCCCSQRKKERSPEEYKKLINRLNRIEGQIRGIRGMVENGAYCPDILVQSAAVNAAVNSFNRELLSSHIRTCVANDIRDGNDEIIDELLDTLQKLMR